MIAELLCCLVIVSILTAFITESSGMMARATAAGLEKRMRTLDFRSIAWEAENVGTSDQMFRGSWQANTDVRAFEKGIGRVEVSVSLSSNAGQDAISWIVWDINGRMR